MDSLWGFRPLASWGLWLLKTVVATPLFLGSPLSSAESWVVRNCCNLMVISGLELMNLEFMKQKLPTLSLQAQKQCRGSKVYPALIYFLWLLLKTQNIYTVLKATNTLIYSFIFLKNQNINTQRMTVQSVPCKKGLTCRVLEVCMLWDKVILSRGNQKEWQMSLVKKGLWVKGHSKPLRDAMTGLQISGWMFQGSLEFRAGSWL